MAGAVQHGDLMPLNVDLQKSDVVETKAIKRPGGDIVRFHGPARVA